MRPIDADALIEKCGGWYVDECTESGFIGTLENLLATEPTIQPQSTTGQLNDGARSTAQSTDLIDRQAAIDAVAEALKQIGVLDIEDVGFVLSALPAAQPEPHEGEWIDKGIFNNGLGISWHCWECSKCRSQKTSTSNFCPNCGAKMRGEQHETD